MKNIKKLFMVLFLVICTFGWSSTICLSVVQPSDSPEISKETTRDIESVILTAFYDLDEIVTNSGVLYDKKYFKDDKYFIEKGIEGQEDYVLVLYVDYDSVPERIPEGKTYAKIKKIFYKVISVKNQETLSSKSVEGKKFTKKLDDPSKAGTLMAEYIAREAYKVILKDKGY